MKWHARVARFSILSLHKNKTKVLKVRLKLFRFNLQVHRLVTIYIYIFLTIIFFNNVSKTLLRILKIKRIFVSIHEWCLRSHFETSCFVEVTDFQEKHYRALMLISQSTLRDFIQHTIQLDISKIPIFRLSVFVFLVDTHNNHPSKYTTLAESATLCEYFKQIRLTSKPF